MEYRLARTIKWKRAFSAFNDEIILPVGSPVLQGNEAGEYWVSKDALPEYMTIARSDLETYGCMVRYHDIVETDIFLDVMATLNGSEPDDESLDESDFQPTLDYLNSYSALSFSLLNAFEMIRGVDEIKEDYATAYNWFCELYTEDLSEKKGD